MISVVIRNKNQATALEFLLRNLTTRYNGQFSEIVVVDNESDDESNLVAQKYGARFETIQDFSYGGSANFAASKAIYDIVVIFSAHSYPVSPDFFKVIKKKFDDNTNLAGVRCLHSHNDYINYIKGVTARMDPNKSGLIFSGSAFNRRVWEVISFNEEVPTFEDKDWTLRVLKKGYDIEYAPVVFSYHIQRSKKQNYFRKSNDLLGNYQIWGQSPTVKNIINSLVVGVFRLCRNFLIDLFYVFKYFFFTVKFMLKKPKKFDY